MSTGIGDALRDEREFLGLSIEQASRDTRVREEYLRALENEDFGVFGGDVYAKGFMSTYARYLELEPAPLLEAYRRQIQRPAEEATEKLASGPVASAGPGGPPTWVIWGVAAAVVLGGIIGLGQLVGGRTPEPSSPEDEAPQPVASPTPTDTVPPSPAPAATATASPTPRPTGVNVVVDVQDRCWMQVTIDDEVVFSDTLESTESESWQSSGPITILYGNPAGVTVELNGEDLGVVSEAGEPETVTYTSEGIEGSGATATPAGGGSANGTPQDR